MTNFIDFQLFMVYLSLNCSNNIKNTFGWEGDGRFRLTAEKNETNKKTIRRTSKQIESWQQKRCSPKCNTSTFKI